MTMFTLFLGGKNNSLYSNLQLKHITTSIFKDRNHTIILTNRGKVLGKNSTPNS